MYLKPREACVVMTYTVTKHNCLKLMLTRQQLCSHDRFRCFITNLVTGCTFACFPSVPFKQLTTRHVIHVVYFLLRNTFVYVGAS